MFNLKAPCKDCPFRNDKTHQKGWLGAERAEEIYENIANQDGFFSCHKTIDYDNPTEGLQKGNNFCAGALILLKHTQECFNNRNYRFAMMLNMIDENTFDMTSPVFKSKDEFVKWHGDQ